jgi:hypothetical protein
MKRTKQQTKEINDRYTQRHPEVKTYKNIVHRAREKNLPCELTQEDVRILLLTEWCPVLGIPLFTSKGSPSDNSPSLDRIDSKKGYTKSNTRCISWRANSLKKDGTAEELIAVAMDVAKLEMEKEKAA